MARFPEYLAGALMRHNRRCDEEARVRLRVAVHAGEVLYDQHGVAGGALNLAFRLLEAAELKSALAASPGTVALIASDWFFEEVIRHDPASGPATFRRVRVEVKETRTTAWIGLPDHPYPPGDGGTDRAVPRTAPAAPRQLLAPISNFVGRTVELTALTRLLDESRGAPVVISTISGTAGVGKTALAVHWAHQVRERFPDGHLYVNLRGYDPGPQMAPGHALDGFLRALNVPAEEIPAEVEEKAGLYRSLLDGRHVLVVLDNAATAEQVRPLLPGSPGCLAVVTSRSRLSGLVARDGAKRISLDPLSPDEAIGLLRQIIGDARVDDDPAATAGLARGCAYLPLALRIAAERVATHPHIGLADLAGDLADEDARLDLLAADEEITAVRSVFSWSYQALSPRAARLFRLLGLHAGPDISLQAAAVLADVDPVTARGLLDTLANAHMLEESAPYRYRFHDLLRVYAAERAAVEETSDDREAATRRLLTWYLHTAHAADLVLIPHRRRVPLDPQECAPPVFTTFDHALEWCDAEHANLVAAIRQAAEHGQHVIAWKLPAMLWGFFQLRRHWTDWIATNQIALRSARSIHDRFGEGWALNFISAAYWDLRRYEEAVEHARQALTISREIGDRWLEGSALVCLGTCYNDLGRYAESVECLHPGLVFVREAGEQVCEGTALIGLGNAYRGLGRFDEAVDYYRQALEHFRRIGNRWGEGWTLHDLAKAYRGQGRLEEAIEHFQRAFAVRCATGERHGQARALLDLGDAQREAGRPEAARDSWRQALAVFEDLRDPQAAETRARMDALVSPPSR
ncbi:tetratricopeptide repeat protein [Actinomadura sp. B10D3]|uniref:ATP-binding protein n=1 Tax=Actinomadura sp. B10D3 TaxID=3153557 RepID=UPI00325C46DB